jgi:homoserine kinase
MTDFVAHAVSVRVPATSANLGPGFDSYGLALDLHDELSARVLETGLSIEVVGEGAGKVPTDETHLVWRAMARLFAEVGVAPGGVELVCHNRIPHGRGLGSSAAAIVGGLVLARALVVDAEVSDDRLLELAAELEGHPDNVAAALLGGFTLAWTDDKVAAIRLDPVPELRAVVAIPAETLSTTRARSVLPASVRHCDAVINVARAGLLVEAITRRPDLLLPATFDRLHQEARSQTYPEAWRAVEVLRATGLAAVVSGAGPTVLVLATTSVIDQVRELVGVDREVWELGIDRAGATVET